MKKISASEIGAFLLKLSEKTPQLSGNILDSLKAKFEAEKVQEVELKVTQEFQSIQFLVVEIRELRKKEKRLLAQIKEKETRIATWINGGNPDETS